jgi:hypothetical protein
MKRADRLTALEIAQPKPVPAKEHVVSERARRAMLFTLEYREKNGTLEDAHRPILERLRTEFASNRTGGVS